MRISDWSSDVCSSDLPIPRAGTVRRPEVDVAPADIRDLGYTIIRVLNRAGEAVGPWAGLLDDGAALQGLRDMMKVRGFDARMLMAQRQGTTSLYMQFHGPGALAGAFQRALSPGAIHFPTSLQQGRLIARGNP